VVCTPRIANSKKELLRTANAFWLKMRAIATGPTTVLRIETIFNRIPDHDLTYENIRILTITNFLPTFVCKFF
jgi:hypothetical protein